MCTREFGIFEMFRQIVLQLFEFLDSIRKLLKYSDEIFGSLSFIFFGEFQHSIFDLNAILEEYFWKYAEELNPLGGKVEGVLHIWSLLFDDSIDEKVFEILKKPVCGISETF